MLVPVGSDNKTAARVVAEQRSSLQLSVLLPRTAVLARGASRLRPVMQDRRLEPPALKQAAHMQRHRGSSLRHAAATISSIAVPIFYVLRHRSPRWLRAAAAYEGRGALLPCHPPHACAQCSLRTALPRQHASGTPNVIPSLAPPRIACAACVPPWRESSAQKCDFPRHR